MHWRFSEEQDAYRDALRGWLGDALGLEQVRRWLGVERAPADPAAFEIRFVEAGMAGVGVDEALGGQGGGAVELAITAEELAFAGAPSAAWLATVVCSGLLTSRAEVMEAALAGENAALVVPAEVIPGQRVLARVDAGGRLTGQVPRVLGADRAGVLVVPAWSNDELGLYLVESTAQGIHRVQRRLLDPSRSVADVRFEQVLGDRLDIDVEIALSRAGALAGVLVAADALGAMQRMLDLAVEYSGQRHQFGVPIGSFQAIKHAAAAILVDVEAARSGVYFAAASLAADAEGCDLHAAAVKAQVTAAAGRAADTALTMHGAIGYTWEHDLHLYFKRARLDAQLFGSAGDWNERIADGLQLTAT